MDTAIIAKKERGCSVTVPAPVQPVDTNTAFAVLIHFQRTVWQNTPDVTNITQNRYEC